MCFHVYGCNASQPCLEREYSNLSTPTDHLIKSNRLTLKQFTGPFINKGPAVPLLWQPIYHTISTCKCIGSIISFLIFVGYT